MNVSTPDYFLIARELAGIATAEETSTLRAWIAADPEHGRIWTVLREAWRLSGEKDHGSSYDADVDWPKVLARIDQLRFATVTPEPVGTGSRPWFRSRAWMVRAAVLAAILLAPWAGWRLMRAKAHPPALAEITAPRGATRETVLPDGSHVRLGAESTIRYAAAFDGPTRVVDLSGMAYFEVIHNSARPFLVHVRDAVTVRDIGTRFVVSAYPENPRVEVAVANGRVALSGGRHSDSEVAIGAGQVGQVGKDGVVTVATDASADPYFAWMRGVLVLEDRPLADAVVKLGRWYDVQLKVEDPHLAAQRISTTAGDILLADVLAKITLALGARSEQRGDTTVIVP